MTRARSNLLCGVLLLALVPVSALAQPPSGLPLESLSWRQQVQPPPTAAPVQTAPERRPDRSRLPQGFSVVLVLGDITASTAVDDVPPAARKALSDMKEFLPYKSYKLLDAAWLLCCGSTSGEVTNRMRGPEDQEYELKLSAYSQFGSREGVATSPPPGDGPRVSVHFSLRDLEESTHGSTPAVAATTATDEAREAEKLKDQIAKLEQELAGARRANKTADVQRLNGEISYLRPRLARLQETRTSGRRPTRAMIDTNFTMDVGETVVVGTSRLKGGSKALIALLTAVPARAPVRKE
jgi:hypothetical protein